MRKAFRGTSLAGAVCVISIALVAALTIASSASLNAGMLQQTENAQIASLLADSAIQQGVAELMKAPTWGSNAATDRVSYAGPVERSSVLLTFDKTAGVPYSTNNQQGASPQGWIDSHLLSNRTVPGERVHLVAVGQCRNVTRTREAVIYVPNFTVSLASTGKVHLNNSIVGSLKSVEDLARVDTQPEVVGPGDLATNSDLSDSVILEVGSRVTGNLQSRGDVSLQSGSTVEGEVRRFFSDTELPHFNFDDYDPARPPAPGEPPALNYQLMSTGFQSGQTLVGSVRCPGSAVINGDLRLDNCLLFVTGDLTVKGALLGAGAVIVKGSTRVEGGTTLTSDDTVALLGRGDVNLIGSTTDPNSYQFQGLVYTRGNFTARNFTVVGGFIADGTVPGTGNVDLHGSRAFQTAVKTKVNLFVPVQLSLQMASANPPGYTSLPIPADSSEIGFGKNPVAPPYQPWPDGTIPVPTASFDQYDTPYEAATFDNPTGDWEWWNPGALVIQVEKVGGVDQFVYYLVYKEGGVQYNQRCLDREAAVKAICDKAQVKCAAYYDGSTVQKTRAYHENFYRSELAAWEAKNRLSGSTTPVNFSFDPNRFLKENDKIRISAVTEY